MCQLYERVNRMLKGDPVDDVHAKKNRQTVESVKEINARVLRELSLSEVVEFVFNEFPSKGVLKALSVLIGRAESMKDLSSAQSHAKAFKNINRSNPIDDTTRITIDMHTLIDDIETFITLSTDENSEDGSLISSSEAEIILKLIHDMDKIQTDLALFVNNRRA